MQNNIKKSPAVLLCGHGSRSSEGTAEFHSLVMQIQRAMPGQRVAAAFLELQSPTITEGLQDIYDQGVREIILQPVTLYNGTHTRHDIPEIMTEFRKKNPDLRLHYGSFLGLTPSIIEAATSAVKSVMPDTAPEECKLLLVGRGSKDRLIADQTINLCRKLHDRLDMGDSRYCYASGGSPLLKTALRQAAESHYNHVIILPFLLFSGRLLSDIYGELDLAAEKYPDFTFYKAPPLGRKNDIVEAIMQRIIAARP